MKSTRFGARRRFAAVLAGVTLVASFGVIAVQATPSSFVELDGNVISNGTGTYDWANSGALTTTGGTYSRAGTGGIFNGGHFNGNTTPPTAPTETATAAADASIADAEFKVDPLSVDVTGCGTGDPTAYTGAGSETNGDILSTDTFGTASIPNKDDLSNVYAVAHLSGAVNEVFFGAERVINNGDSHIDFEFLQSKVSIPNACSGSFTGNRTQGDFLLAVDFTTGGTLGGTTLYKWQCDTVFDLTHNGNVCNPVKKSQAHYESTGTSAVVIKVNDASIGTIGCGGWVCRNPDGTPTTSIAQNELMEGGIDLAQLGFTGCVSTFLPHTRSSQSFTAVLKDFEIIPFDTCKSPTVTTTIVPAGPLAIGATAHDTATIHDATASAGGTISYNLYSNNDCTGLLADLTPTVNTVVNGVAPDSKTFTFNNAGTFYFYAEYSGDARNKGPVNSGCAAEPLVINPNTPAVSTTIVPAGPVALGTVAHDTATITGATATAGGTITYALYSKNDCTGLLADLTPTVNTVVNHIAPDSKTFTFNNAGTFYFYAVYSGDNNNTGPVNSGCAAEPYTVNPNTPVPDSIPIVQIKDTLHVTGLTGDATGNVLVGLYTSPTCTTGQIGSNDSFAASTNVNGTLTAATSFVVVTAGTYYYKISYVGDNNNTGFTSCAENVGVTITSLP